MPEYDAPWSLDLPQPEEMSPASALSPQAEPAVQPPVVPNDPVAGGKRFFSSTLPTAAPPPLERLVEALLFALPQPVTAAQAMESIRGLTPEQFQQTVVALQLQYRRQGRPYGVLRQGEGYRLALRPAFRGVVERLYGGVKEARLTAHMVETLAVVAYRQPVSKTEVDSLRGQDSGPMLRQLLRRGLIAILDKSPDGSGEVRFHTPPRFLEFFRLSGLEDLPRVDDLPYL